MAGLAAAAGGLVAWALAHPTRPPAEQRHASTAPTLARDVLTGRLLREDGTPLPPTSGPGSAEQPLRLRFVPSGDNLNSGGAVEGMLQFLRQRTGYAVEAKILRSYGLVVTEIVHGMCDVAFLTSVSYARAWYATNADDQRDDDITVLLSVVRQGNPEFPGSDLSYRGAIFVRRDSPLTDVRQLTPAHTIAMGNRTSGASSMLPTAYLSTLNVRPRVQRFEGYPIIINAVLEGTVDAGCLWWMPPNPDNPENDARILMKSTIPDVFERSRILAHTPWIPNEPVVARAALPAEVRHTMARALSLYVSLRSLTEAGRRELESIGSVVGLIPADDGDFRALFETVERAFAEDPEGRADFMRGDR